jgi:radial spoke head protein 4/6
VRHPVPENNVARHGQFAHARAMDLTTARAYLQRREPALGAAAPPDAAAGGGGGSVYDHLTDVVVALLIEQPGGALEAFEAVSARVKAAGAGLAGALAAATTTTTTSLPAAAGTHASAAEDDALRGRRLGALAALTAPAAPAEGEAAPAAVPADTQEVLADVGLLEWAGVSVGSRADAYRLALALKALVASRPGLGGVRWWGSLHGTAGGDYIVAEGTYADAADYLGAGAGADVAASHDGGPLRDATGHAIHPGGAPGPNERAYFVCAAPGEPWVALPPVTPHQVTAARSLRRFLTGSLAAPVGGHPPFPGGEAALLRATIALITADTALAPAGAFTAAEDGGGGIVPVPPEERAPPGDLADPA